MPFTNKRCIIGDLKGRITALVCKVNQTAAWTMFY